MAIACRTASDYFVRDTGRQEEYDIREIQNSQMTRFESMCLLEKVRRGRRLWRGQASKKWERQEDNTNVFIRGETSRGERLVRKNSRFKKIEAVCDIHQFLPGVDDCEKRNDSEGCLGVVGGLS